LAQIAKRGIAMNPEQRFWAILAGLASGLLCVLALILGNASVLMGLTPFAPLFLVGFSFGVQTVLPASLIATAAVLLLTGGSGGLFFLAIFAIPVSFYVHRTLTCLVLSPHIMQQIQNAKLLKGSDTAEKGGGMQGDHKMAAWFPQGLVLTHLTYYFAFLVGISVLSVVSQENTGSLMEQIFPAFKTIPEWLEIRDQVARWEFLIVGFSAWISLSVFYGIAVLCNFLLVGYGRAVCPSLAVLPFMAGGELLALLLGAGLFSVADSPLLSLPAKAVFVVLLYPYFLMGLSRLHWFTRSWNHRGLLLTAFYLLMLMFYPIVAGLIGWGLAVQARVLSNHVMGQTS
jgi:hypothetical protein